MSVQLPGSYGRHILRLSQPGDAEAVVPAHGPEHLLPGVDPLVIEGGLYGADEVFLLPLHIVRIQGAPHQPGPEKHLPQQLRHRLQNPVPLQGKPVLQKAEVEAPGLDFPILPHQRPQACAIQAVQRLGNALQIRVNICTLDQHVGQEGIFRRLGPAQRPEKATAEAGAFKPPGGYAPEAHTGKQLDCLLHRLHPLFSLQQDSPAS